MKSTKELLAKEHLALATLALALMVGGVGCDSASTNQAFTVTVVNGTGELLAFQAVGHRVDPDPAIPVDALTSRASASGFLLDSAAAVALEKADVNGGYRADQPFRLYLYDVRDDTAYTAGYRKFSHDKLERKDFRVEINVRPKILSVSRNAGGEGWLFAEADISRWGFSTEQWKLLSVTLSKPWTAGLYITRLASDPAALLQRGGSITIPIAPDQRVVATSEDVQQRGPHDISWTGSLKKKYGQIILVLSSEGVTGTLSIGTPQGGIEGYRFMPLSGKLQAAIRIDASKFPPDHPVDVLRD